MTQARRTPSPADPADGDRARPGAAIFVLAHHDDEVFCAGHLLRAMSTGRRLRILWVTAGALAPVLYVPAYEGGHPDHDAVNLAVAVLRSRRPEVGAREFPLYRRGPAGLSVQAPQPTACTSQEPYLVLPLGDDALALRRCLACANRSQLLPSLAPLLALAWAAGRGRAEPSRPLPAHDYTRPPHRRRLLYEFYTRRRFGEFRAAAIAALPRSGSCDTDAPPSPRSA